MQAVNNIKNIVDNATNIYHYGSFVYGTHNPEKSDYDYIVIVPDEQTELDKQQMEYNNNQYSFYTKNTWQQKLDNNDVDAIETYFLPQKFIIKETEHFVTRIQTQKIRENFSKVASNSFVKCKKKLTVEKDYNPRVAKKSLWHSIRILKFGIQILKGGCIYDYTEANHLYNKIVENENDDWGYYKENYQKIYNAHKSLFRIAEKEA